MARKSKCLPSQSNSILNNPTSNLPNKTRNICMNRNLLKELHDLLCTNHMLHQNKSEERSPKIITPINDTHLVSENEEKNQKK